MGAACGRCGASLRATIWSKLEVVEQVPHGRVREHVTHWPDGAGIEVRRCRCGHALARMVARVP